VLASWFIRTGVNYEHFVWRQTNAVFTAEMTHEEFFQEDLSNRIADLQGGLRWRASRRFTFRGTAGAQVSVVDLPAIDDVPVSADVSLNPSGLIELHWDFIKSKFLVADLEWTAEISGFVDQSLGVYVPQARMLLALGVAQPWADFVLTGETATPTESNPTIDSLNPAFYRVNAQLEVPVSAYLQVYLRGFVSQRAPSFGAEDFAFNSLEATGELGIRLWYSTGRDPRLPRPSRVLDADAAGG
jgi:hypothetical protein